MNDWDTSYTNSDGTDYYGYDDGCGGTVWYDGDGNCDCRTN